DGAGGGGAAAGGGRGEVRGLSRQRGRRLRLAAVDLVAQRVGRDRRAAPPVQRVQRDRAAGGDLDGAGARAQRRQQHGGGARRAGRGWAGARARGDGRGRVPADGLGVHAGGRDRRVGRGQRVGPGGVPGDVRAADRR